MWVFHLILVVQAEQMNKSVGSKMGDKTNSSWSCFKQQVAVLSSEKAKCHQAADKIRISESLNMFRIAWLSSDRAVPSLSCCTLLQLTFDWLQWSHLLFLCVTVKSPNPDSAWFILQTQVQDKNPHNFTFITKILQSYVWTRTAEFLAKYKMCHWGFMELN